MLCKIEIIFITLMKDIASYCDEIIVQSKQNIRKTESNLKKETAKEVYFQIEETNEAKTKRLFNVSLKN